MSTLDQTREPEQLAALSALVKGVPPALAPQFDFESFKFFLRYHRLAGQVYALVRQREDLRAALPPRFVQSLKREYLEVWADNEKLARELSRLTAEIRADGVEPLYFKGPLHAVRFVPEPLSRVSADLDILARDWAELEAIGRAAERCGYRRESARLGGSLSSKFTSHYEYRSDRAALDLHWRLKSHYTIRLDYPAIFARAEKVDLRGETFLAISAEDELVAQLFSVFTDCQHGNAALKAALDLFAISRHLEMRGFDWGGFFERKRKEGLYRVALNVLYAALGTLDLVDELPRLSGELSERRADRVERPGSPGAALFRPGLLSWPARSWALRLYDGSRLGCMGWALISLPFRLAEHPEWRKETGRKVRDLMCWPGWKR